VFILGAEGFLASVLLDTRELTWSNGWFVGFIGMVGPWSVRFLIGFAAIYGTFAFLKHRQALVDIAVQTGPFPVRWGVLLMHVPALAAFAALSRILFRQAAVSVSPNLIATLWAATGLATVGFCAFALIPPRLWAQLAKRTGKLWMFSLAASAIACSAGALTDTLWKPTSKLTFQLVKLFLSPVVREMVIRPERMLIGTQRFSVTISPECSGLEGIGLFLVFGSLWLVLFRDETRFPRSLILLPAGVIVLFLLNSIRIGILILIGSAGAREIAVGGFHSQAGWITFNSVALGFCVAARHVPWLSRAPLKVRREGTAHDATSAYLVPFLAILAAGILSRAIAGNFEWFYGLRFVAAAAALWGFRKTYAGIYGTFGWIPVAIGGIVFVFWLALDFLAAGTATIGMPSRLATASPQLRAAWIAMRVLTGVIAVPIAEELAFRGFLMRRLVAADFTAVPLRELKWFPVLVSSLLFGVLHGGRWFAGSLAGILYAKAASHRGRLVDAMVAHAVTNALLASYVLITGQWSLW